MYYWRFVMAPVRSVVSHGSLWFRCILALVLMAAGLFVTTEAQAHAMLHERVEGESVILRLAFPGGEQPLFDPYEVFAPGEPQAFQSGRVNALGEVSFRPDRAGRWRLRVIAENGHGMELKIEVDEAGIVSGVGAGHDHAGGYWPRVLAALGYLLGIFGLLVLWRQRKARAG